MQGYVIEYCDVLGVFCGIFGVFGFGIHTCKDIFEYFGYPLLWLSMFACKWVRCTLRSWVHELFSHYRTVSPGLGDNCVNKCSSDSFSHTNICHYAWKTLKTTLWCFIVLQSQGEGLKSKENYGTDLSHSFFFSISWPSPYDWRTMMHFSVVLTVFNTWWCIFCVWIHISTTLQRIVVNQSWGYRFNVKTLHGPRIWECNGCYSKFFDVLVGFCMFCSLLNVLAHHLWVLLLKSTLFHCTLIQDHKTFMS